MREWCNPLRNPVLLGTPLSLLRLKLLRRTDPRAGSSLPASCRIGGRTQRQEVSAIHHRTPVVSPFAPTRKGSRSWAVSRTLGAKHGWKRQASRQRAIWGLIYIITPFSIVQSFFHQYVAVQVDLTTINTWQTLKKITFTDLIVLP